MSEDMPPLTLTAPKLFNLLSLNDQNGKPLVTIGQDGTVTVHELGSEPKAAKIFWDSLHIHGVSLFNQITLLTEELKATRQRLEGDIRVLQQEKEFLAKTNDDNLNRLERALTENARLKHLTTRRYL